MGDFFDQLKALPGQASTKIQAVKAKSNVVVKCAMEAALTMPQAGILGAGSFMFNDMVKDAQAKNPNMTPDMRAQMEKMQATQPKTIVASIRNFAALFGVQAATKEAMKHARKDRDIWTEVVPAFAAGTAYALASGHPDQVLVMAGGFGAFTALIYQFTGGEQQSGAGGISEKEAMYSQSLHMLKYLNLEKYHKNLKNGLMTDQTIMLWNEAALKDCQIPPGPRLLMMHHLSQVKAAHPKGDTAKQFLSPTAPVEIPGASQAAPAKKA